MPLSETFRGSSSIDFLRSFDNPDNAQDTSCSRARNVQNWRKVWPQNSCRGLSVRGFLGACSNVRFGTCDLERGNFSASDIFFFFTSIVCSVRASLFILMPPLGFEPWTSWLDLLLMLCLRQFGYSATPIEPGCSLFFFFFYLKWIQDSIPLPYKTLILSCYKETSSTVRLSLTNV